MAAPTHTARLKTRYEQEIKPELIRRFGYSSSMQAPKIKKITLNMGVGDAKQDSKALEAATEQLATIAGQRPNVRRARKSIAAFKLREGMPVGISVTLRGERGYEFLDRLMSIAIPRIRDFRGMNPRSFDGRGNYSMGVREQIIFPEIDYDAIDQTRGMDITITTSAHTDVEAFVLLDLFGFPFAQEGRPEVPGGPAPRESDAPAAEAAASNGHGAPTAESVPDAAPTAEEESPAPLATWGEEPGAEEDFTGVEEASREPDEADSYEPADGADAAADVAALDSQAEPEAQAPSFAPPPASTGAEEAPSEGESVNDVSAQEPASATPETDAEADEE